MENEVVQLYLDDIIPNRFQPREVFDDQALKELAVSIREHGVIQPILVRKFGEKYEIIAGERRYKASTMAGLTKIPAIVKNLDDKESSKVALIENLQRRDLTPIEEARTYQKILDLDEMTQEQLAKTMGKSQSAVSNKLRLLSLPDEIQESLLKEEISERHARSLLNVTDKNVQIDLLKEIVNNKMTVRELDSKIKSLNGEEQPADSDVSGGNALFTETVTAPAEVQTENNDSLFGTAPVVEEKVEPSAPDMNSLFGDAPKEENNNDSLNVENNVPVENNGLDSLFGSSAPVVEEKVEPVTNELPVENSNDLNSLFGTPTQEVAPTESINNDSLVVNNTEVPTENNTESTNLFDDPTVVDIDKVREQSSDINFNINNNVTNNEIQNNMDNLLGKNDDSTSRFIPNFEETMIEKTEDGNEVIGNGLLAGMPVIKPVESENIVEEKVETTNDTTPKSEFDSLFGAPAPAPVAETPADLNSLFGNNDTATVVENSIQDMPTPNDLFGTTQNAVNNDSMISTNNVQVAVEEVKNSVQSYLDKGYKISIEELDLDQEIQLIIKFNKN